jgi:hypothetical protein
LTLHEPKGERRHVDVIGSAAQDMRVATGERAD